MSDDPVHTIVHTNEGLLSFQDYFVARRCEPVVSGFEFEGIENAKPAPGLIEAINEAEQIIVCPSNPWVSIDPILNVAGIRDALSTKPVIAVSPIIKGKTIKGPAAKMYKELDIEPSVFAVYEHYHDILDRFVIDTLDSELSGQFPIPTLVTNTIMKNRQDRIDLAEKVLGFR